MYPPTSLRANPDLGWEEGGIWGGRRGGSRVGGGGGVCGGRRGGSRVGGGGDLGWEKGGDLGCEKERGGGGGWMARPMIWGNNLRNTKINIQSYVQV